MRRFQANGDIDLMFGQIGSVEIRRPSTHNVQVSPQAIVVEQDGRIFVSGFYDWYDGAYHSRWFIIRHSPDGSPDASIPYTELPFTGENHGTCRAAAIQADGRNILAGDASRQSGGIGTERVARLTADGKLDPTFNGTGLLSTNKIDRAFSLALQPDGKILVGGSGGYQGFTVLRLLSSN